MAKFLHTECALQNRLKIGGSMKLNFKLLGSAFFASAIAGSSARASDQPIDIKDIESLRKSLAIDEIQLEAEKLPNLNKQEKEYLKFLLEKVKRGSLMRNGNDCEIGR